ESLPDVNVMSRPGAVRLGIRADQRFFGPGVRVETVVEESAAEGMGLQDGDVIFELDGVAVRGLGVLRDLLAHKKDGDEITLKVAREQEDLLLEGRFPEFEPRPVYPRELPTAHIFVTATKNTVAVASRNVRRFRLLLSPLQFDLSRELVVRGNGRIHRLTPEASLKLLLERYASEADSGRLFAAEAEVDVTRQGTGR
ncbi:MAG: PDZ domain-containing protein, partial [Planctomycetota bacterium]